MWLRQDGKGRPLTESLDVTKAAAGLLRVCQRRLRQQGSNHNRGAPAKGGVEVKAYGQANQASAPPQEDGPASECEAMNEVLSRSDCEGFSGVLLKVTSNKSVERNVEQCGSRGRQGPSAQVNR